MTKRIRLSTSLLLFTLLIVAAGLGARVYRLQDENAALEQENAKQQIEIIKLKFENQRLLLLNKYTST